MTEEKPKFLKAVEERRARIAAEEAAKAAAEADVDPKSIPAEYNDAIPDLGDTDQVGDRTEEFQSEDQAIKSLRILDVYMKLVGGKKPDKSGGKDETLVFCPDAHHQNDNSEAACINTAKNTWVCYRDGNEGGSVIDMVAASQGMGFGKDLKGKDYAVAKRMTLERFCGWTYTREGTREVGRSPEAQRLHEQQFAERLAASQKDTNDASHEPEPPTPTLQVVPEVNESEDDPDDLEGGPVIPDVLPEIDNIFEHIPEDTPLYVWMETLNQLPIPQEYKLFRGLQLLSVAGGPCLRGDVGGLFKTTLSVLFVGGSGVGKSQSRRAMDMVLEDPIFKWNSTSGAPYGTHSYNGVKSIPDPGSGEFLLKHMSHYEPSDGSMGYGVRDVMAMVEYDEFAHFMAKATQKNGSLMTVFQQFDNSPTLDGKIEVGSLSGGTHRAVNANVIFSAGVQPKMLSKVIGRHNVDNGFLARFEIVTGNRIVAKSYREEEIPNMQHARTMFKGLALYYAGKAYPDNDKTKRPEMHTLCLGKDADKEFDRYWSHLQHSRDSDIKTRFDLKFKKLCALFAINRQADEIGHEDVLSAEWVMEFLGRAAELSETKTGSTDEIELEEAIMTSVAHLTQRDGYATVGKVASHARAKARGWDNERIGRKLQRAAERGDLEIDPRKAKRGPQSLRYVLLGALDEGQLASVKVAKKLRDKAEKAARDE